MFCLLDRACWELCRSSYPHPRCLLGMEKAPGSSQMHPISSKSERAKGTIHSHLSSDTCPWMLSESPYRIAAKWALGTQLARPRQCPQLLALRAGSLTARPGLGPRAEGFCSQLAARRSPLRVFNPRARGVGLLPAAAAVGAQAATAATARVSPWGPHTSQMLPTRGRGSATRSP